MTIQVTFDAQHKQYIVSNSGKPVAILPLVYLEGRKSTHLGHGDIEKAFVDVFDHPKNYQSDIQRKDAALVSLGLIDA